ncbi:MAG: hypothetical protein ACK4UN_21390 [Limisphaerales bacterium]
MGNSDTLGYLLALIVGAADKQDRLHLGELWAKPGTAKKAR